VPGNLVTPNETPEARNGVTCSGLLVCSSELN
jgi:hypothetical protein